MKKNLILITLVVLSALGMKGQYANQQALYFGLPQAKYLNPGVFPEYDGYFSLPALSGWGVTGSNSGFSWNDMFETGNLQLERLVPLLNEKNFLNVGLGFDAFGLGFKSGKNFFSFNLTPKVDVNFGYNKSVFDFLTNGNGNYIGESISLDGFGFDISAYTEAGIGYTREVTEDLSIGGRAKLLLGIANLNGNFDGISLYTDPDDYSLTATSEFAINSYGAFLINDSISDVLGNPSVVNFSNIGLGLDLGANYQLNDKINVFASLVDLGFMKWADNGESLYNDGASFTFDGIPFQELLGSDESGSEEESGFFNDLGDSLSNTFELQRSKQDYTTRLKTRFFAGASYELNKYFDGQAMLHGRVFNGRIYPMYMLGGSFHLKKWLTTKLTYSGANGTFDNIGAGLVLHLGAFQIYGMLDNAIGLTAVDYQKFLNGSFGINFTFKSDDKALKKAKNKKAKAQKKKDKIEKSKKLSEDEKKKEIEKQEKIITDQEKVLKKAESKKLKEEKKEKVEEKKEKAEEKQERAEEKKENAEEKQEKVEEKKEKAEGRQEKEEKKEIQSEMKEIKQETKELKQEQRDLEKETKELKQETKVIGVNTLTPKSLEVEKDSVFVSPSKLNPIKVDSTATDISNELDRLKQDSLIVPQLINNSDTLLQDSLMQKKESLQLKNDSVKNILQE